MDMSETSLYGASLEDKEIEELRTIAHHRHALLNSLENELAALRSPTDQDSRVAALAGAVKMCVEREDLDPSDRIKLAKELLSDIREDHTHHAPLSNHGPMAQHGAQGVHFVQADGSIARHPADEMVQKKEQARKAAMKERPDHPYIGNEGAFADWYQLRENVWSERGFDTREMRYNSRPERGIAYRTVAAVEAGRENFVQWEQRTSDMISRTAAYQVIESKVGPLVPPCLKDGDAYVPVQQPPEHIEWGCGDVYVNKHREQQQIHSMQKQHAQAGLWPHGKPERVDADFLLRYGLAETPAEPLPGMKALPSMEEQIQRNEAQGFAVDRLAIAKSGALQSAQPQPGFLGGLLHAPASFAAAAR